MSAVVPARQGRENQRYHEDGRRLVAGGVVSRRRHDGPEVLLISSLNTPDWVLPKGGWETDETACEAAVRETLEEAGVQCTLGASLGTFNITSTKGNTSLWHMWMLHEQSWLDDWAESHRKRQYFPLDEAMKIIRPNMLPVLQKAKDLL
eukprot:TRINITY_DN2515_c0_g1_i4.p1 TRINITY_DN2515_c0_g1~~TRINITY_DN2515_c0_g1_i4.p1  ORF type:complete len:149 (+),score=32.91 TRINITY_DN2515_c0_g1_i4:41-487(+)